MSNYLLGQGSIFVAERDANGKPKALRWLRDVSSAKIALKTTEVNHKESYSGQRSTAKVITTGKEASIDLTLMEMSGENLAMATQGKLAQVTNGTITNEVLPIGLVAGDRIALKYPKVSAVTITDSTGTPATLDPAKYHVNAEYGAIVLDDLTGVTQPLKVAYSYAALETVAIFAEGQKQTFWRYEGINLAEEGKPIIVELYRVTAKPLKDLSLITDKLSDMNISADVLIDTTKPANSDLGQFGRILQGAT